MLKGNPIIGAHYLLRGLGMLAEPKIRHFVIIPLILNTLLFSAAITLLVDQFDHWVNYWLNYLPEWLSFLDWLLWPLFALLVLVTVYYGFTLLGNLIAAPFNGLLSEKVEQQLRGTAPPDEGWKAVLAVIPRTIARELSKLAYYLPRFLLLLVITMIPVVNIIAPFLWLLFGAWMMAIQYCDYPMDNNKISFRQMLGLLKGQNLSSLGFGGLVQLLMLIPLVNLILMPVAVIGATIFWVEKFSVAR